MTRAPALHTTDARGLDDQPAGVSPPEALPERPVDVSLVASPREVRDLVQETRQEVASEDCDCEEECGCGASDEGALSAGRHRVGDHYGPCPACAGRSS